jgi:hypothetical protein
MTRHTASSNAYVDYEEGVAYDLQLDSMQLKEGEYKGEETQQILFVFTCDAIKEKDECWVFAAFKFGKHQGKVSKMRGIVNALHGKPEGGEVDWVDDADFTVKFADEAKPLPIKPGMKLKGKGEYYENTKGDTRFRFNRFCPIDGSFGPKAPRRDGGQGDVDPDTIPF